MKDPRNNKFGVVNLSKYSARISVVSYEEKPRKFYFENFILVTWQSIDCCIDSVDHNLLFLH